MAARRTLPSKFVIKILLGIHQPTGVLKHGDSTPLKKKNKNNNNNNNNTRLTASYIRFGSRKLGCNVDKGRVFLMYDSNSVSFPNKGSQRFLIATQGTTV